MHMHKIYIYIYDDFFKIKNIYIMYFMICRFLAKVSTDRTDKQQDYDYSEETATSRRGK